MANQWCSAARRWALVLGVALAGFGGNASAILLDRGPDMVYDTVLNITWIRQAGDGVARNWPDSVAWANNLVFAGFDDWRLPWASVIAGAGPAGTYACNGSGGADELACRDNEMGYMFYYNLGGKFGDDKSGTQTAVGGEVLTGIQSRPVYWSGTADNIELASYFDFNIGLRLVASKSLPESAWAVRPGDVCAQSPELCVEGIAPEPASLLLLGLGMLALGGVRRRKS
jgi:PEP-CTERM motif